LVPSLVLIDGGKGHLSAVQQVFLELGVTDIPLASIAKEREELFLPHVPEPILLPRGSQGLYLVQRIRDEAHRFAITYHRQRRSKASTRSALDSVALEIMQNHMETCCTAAIRSDDHDLAQARIEEFVATVRRFIK
ncbi:metal-sensing transcriptional repressor, partial [bacterium]|nr:metal-sensing transcriptional repressor [bacterium]